MSQDRQEAILQEIEKITGKKRNDKLDYDKFGSFLESLNKTGLEGKVREELFSQMMRRKSPPDIESFAVVYLQAIDWLKAKVNKEQRKIDAVDEANRNAQQISNSWTFEQKKQFVFRVVEVNPKVSPNPLFEIQTQNLYQKWVKFSEFEEKDIFLDIGEKDEIISIKAYNDQNKQIIADFDIRLDDYLNKKRIENVFSSPNNFIEIYYDGQIIDDYGDYLKELITINNQKQQDYQETKGIFNKMKSDLSNLFPGVNLNEAQKEVDIMKWNSLNIRDSIIDASEVIQQGNDFPNVNNEQYVPLTEQSEYVNWHNFVDFLFFANIALLIVSLFVNFDRTSFLSITIALIYCLWWAVKDINVHIIKSILLVIAYSLALASDLLWLILDSKNLWSYDYYYNDLSNVGLQKFVVVMSYILVIIEGICVFLSIVLLQQGMYDKQLSKSQKKEIDILI